jgi:hypothetical protein
MTHFTRVVTLAVAIVLYLAVVLVAGAPAQAIAWAQGSVDWLGQFLASLEALSPAWIYPIGRVLALVLATVALLALLWLELRRRKVPVVRVQLPSGAQATVTAESVARRLAWHVDQLADVVNAMPQVRTRGTSVDILMVLETAPEVDIPLKSEEVMVVVKEVVERDMGLQLRQLKVEVHHAPYPDRNHTVNSASKR